MAARATFGPTPGRDSQWREVAPLGPQPDGESGADDAVGDQFSRRWEQPHPCGDGTILRTTFSATAMDDGERRWIAIDTEWQWLDARGEELGSWGDVADSHRDGPSGELWPTPADVRAEIAPSWPADWDHTPLADTAGGQYRCNPNYATPTRRQTTTPGLVVEKAHHGSYLVRHAQSGLPAASGIRLQRDAIAIADQLGRYGVDYTRPARTIATQWDHAIVGGAAAIARWTKSWEHNGDQFPARPIAAPAATGQPIPSLPGPGRRENNQRLWRVHYISASGETRSVVVAARTDRGARRHARRCINQFATTSGDRWDRCTSVDPPGTFR